MIIAAKTSDEIRDVKDALKSAFKMKELGPVKFILGMEIDHDMAAGTLMIKQTRYIDDVAERFGQENAKPVENPCTTGLKFSRSQSPATDAERSAMRSRPYRSLIGCLLYITTCTRPDIAFVVAQLSRFLENPGQQHWNAAIRVLRYLKTTRQHGIIYQGWFWQRHGGSLLGCGLGYQPRRQAFCLGCHGDDWERSCGVQVQVSTNGCAQLCGS